MQRRKLDNLEQKKTKSIIKFIAEKDQIFPCFLKRVKTRSFSFVACKRRSKKMKYFYLGLSGAVIGFINGFFGGGGGMICVPILQKVMRLKPKEAHATAIMVIFPLSIISSLIYIFNKSIENLPLITVGLGVVAGGIIGSFALKFLPPKTVQIIFILIMFAGGVKLLI